MSYISIGKELRITSEKARCTYDSFYHEKVLELINDLKEKAESDEARLEIFMHYFKEYRTSKKRYDALTKS